MKIIVHNEMEFTVEQSDGVWVVRPTHDTTWSIESEEYESVVQMVPQFEELIRESSVQ